MEGWKPLRRTSVTTDVTDLRKQAKEGLAAAVSTLDPFRGRMAAAFDVGFGQEGSCVVWQRRYSKSFFRQ